MNRDEFLKKTAAPGALANTPATTSNARDMQKKLLYKTNGHRADIGPFKITRLVSNSHAEHVGHFVFLDHIHPTESSEKRLNPEAAHPHRGIATLTYILHGEVEHFDSRQHTGLVHSGGVQWMKAGNGIIHNEAVGPDTKAGHKKLHGFQFWLNLPSEQKKKDPEYMAVEAGELPVIHLEEGAGTLKVVVGAYMGQASKIPVYADQHLYHLTLRAGKHCVLSVANGQDYAAFSWQHGVTINGEPCEAGYLIGFGDEGRTIEFKNQTETEIELLVFGGEKYTEPYVAYGPFVMSTKGEIAQAYADYQAGKYGKMIYS